MGEGSVPEYAQFIAMTEKPVEKTDRSYNNSLYPEDQEKVDEFISRGVNSVERKPFKPGRMMLLLILVVTSLSILSQFLARYAGLE
jgi:hypothetical protein